ncbi:1-deoxy-D-xylulose-5-phosphate synthase [Caldinitratiruptor microaerophilus]|uniref:1-deoxy-D-xylulose-5-phosphate synthase n=1 Tax=Caldinitratiruptor microaerophilus TaxID=671077 RepID=A0AA35CIX1_9FIRM|nr:1-deoxy-D-xylulose-5-phosphate synthase [Caldinitratiruptor microaerophilus]BDG59887.1 1-deoxy-D-xylulose-5-phosphate synthase [Caldinitratiruptor microaerophilus]
MLLEGIRGPEDLRGLSVPELERLAGEIRQVVVETVARTGGHLAPNLGVVELTLALHTVFSSPQDKILWDVSHQSYPHKLVTGRLPLFHTLRQVGGLAGYTHPAESPHDHFHWGHASTALSAAIGLAKARDLAGETYDVVAVVGDGALTGGMAFEALDHGGHDKTRVIVVLNDNSMSISPNVGGISQLLARIRTGPHYQALKQQAAEVLKGLPVFGPQAFDVVDRMKEGVKHLLLPTMFFEDLGWTYLGPVDGHNLTALQAALRQARSLREPVVVHVVTTKGKGIPYAEELPDKYHGGGPFDIATGRFLPGATTYSEVFGNTMVRIAREDPDVVAITAAMPGGTGLSRFAREFPDRFFDVGIAEQHAAAFAAGLAKGGKKPVFAVYSTFLQRAYDQVIHDVALQGLPVVFAIDRAGLVEDGATHQGVFDVAYLRCVPGIVVGAPRDENELQHMLYTGIRYRGGPFALRYPRGKAQGVPLDAELRELPIGKGEVLRPGRDAAVLALGVWAPAALAAARALEAEGLDVMVADARWVKPLDLDLVREAAATGRIVTVEEAALAGGFGSAVLEALADLGLSGVEVRRLGVPDRFVPHGRPAHYLEEIGLSAEGIAAAVRDVVLAGRRQMPARRPGARSRVAAHRSGGA